MSKLPDAIIAILESSINQYLALDPSVNHSLDVLENKSVTLELKEFSFPVYFKIDNQKIKVYSELDEETDVSLRTSLPVLINMSIASNGDESILGSDIEMSGNMDVGRHFRDVFKNLDIDWEEIVSRYTGDVIAHKLGNGVRQFKHWLGGTRQSIEKDITEYLQEESSQLPTTSEVDSYISQVDTIRLAVERAEARINLLKNSIEKK